MLEPRRGDPAQVSTREEGMSTLRLHREAGVRQVQGVGEAGTRQKEVGQKRSSSKRPRITRELKAISVVGAQRESQVCGEK